MEIRGANGLRQAVRQYWRLCAAGDSGPYNQVSAASIIREALAGSPRASMLLSILSEVPAPVSSLYLMRAMQVDLDRSTIPTVLFTFTEYGLVSRVWDNPAGRRGGRWLYELSGLGRLVMGKDVRNGHGPEA